MAEITSILPIDPITFDFQEYSISDSSLINSTTIETSFNPSTDLIEYFIYDINNNILFENVNGFPGYKLIDNNIVINPEEALKSLGYSEGQFNTLYNFVSPKLASTAGSRYFISEISPDRTEIRLDTTTIPNALVISSSLELLDSINNATGSYYDFYLDFGNNELIIANNILLDTTSATNPTVLIKLYEPLPVQFNIKTECWAVTQVATSVAYNISITQTFDIIDDNIYIKGPNTNINIQDQLNNSTAYASYNNLTSTVSSQGTGSLQYQLNNLLAQTGVTINIDYSDYSNFIHFSSAQTRLENFYYKLSLLEDYNNNASLSNNTTTNYYVSSSNVIYQNKINEIITTFDDYENYLYFSSGSTSWPKVNSTPPYINVTTGSVAGLAFFTSQSLVAENYDLDNNNALINAIPSFISEDSSNAQFELFIEMIGQSFDNVFVYLQDVTNKYDADNRLNYGVSKDLIADVLRDLGITIYQNNFSSNDLYQALIGLTPSGSLYNLPYTTGSLPTPTGWTYINNYVITSPTSSLVPTEDINKSQYKRIFHNLPYLLKKKGTVEGVKALITTFGIPDTILRINEFGGKDKNFNSYDNWQNEFNYAFYTSGSSYISSSFVLNSSWGATSDNPQSVEFRFRTDVLPQNTASVTTQSLWQTDQNVSLILKYTGSGYTSGSYLGSIIDPYYQYAKLDFTPDPVTPSNTASVYLPFYNEGWWSVLINKNSNVYTLYAKNKNYKGEDGNVISFQASSSVTSAATSWNSSTISYFGISSSLTGKIFTGSLQEIRYYTLPLPENNFDAYIMNPYSIESSENLAFRATLGGELYTASISVHPKVTGSWITTSSFASNSNFYTSSGVYIPNTEVFYFDQVPAGIQNAISDKIKQQNIILPYSSSISNVPNADVLSPYISVQQDYSISQSYTRDIDYVEVAFSPQNEINDDINSQIGYFNLGEVIGDPRFQSSSLDTYPDLDQIRNSYFEKYIKNYDEVDYVGLIKFFDNSLFKMVQDWIPARASVAAGIIIKQTLLERNRYRTPQVNISSSIANVASASTNIAYVTEDLLITGSIETAFITGSNGGSMPELFGLTSSVFTYTNAVNITQSWVGSTPSLSGSVPFTQSSQTEFFDGQLSGSNLIVTNGDLSDCNVEIIQIYNTASFGNPLNTNQYFTGYTFNSSKTYYLSFTITNTDVSFATGVALYDFTPTYNNTPNYLYSSGYIGIGDSVTVNYLELQGLTPPLVFTPTDIGSVSVTNLTIYESYIEPDCDVLSGDIGVSRPNPKFFDVDFTQGGIYPVNYGTIITASLGSGSSTPSTVPQSNYTTARSINPRYLGCKNTSPDFNIPLENKLPVVEQLTSYFAYSLGGGNTLAERSGSGDYLISYLVDEIGNVIKPDYSSSIYLPSLLDAFGTETTVILSPTNNTTLAQPEFTIYKPAVVSNTILYSDTGSLGNNYLVSGSYASLNFNIVPGLYNQPYALNVENLGQNINTGIIATASFSTINLDQAGGFNTITNIYTVQNTSPVRTVFSASFNIENVGAGNTSASVRLFENNNQIALQSKNISSLGNVDFVVTSSLFLSSGSKYYVTIGTTLENVAVNTSLWTITPLTGSIIVNKPYFTTGSTSTSVLTSSAALGTLYGSYQQTPVSGSGFKTPVVLSFQPYDEIRFEGNESLVSTIISSSFNKPTGLFYLYLQQPINTTAVDINYFAIRRWIPSLNNLIINSPGNVMGAGFILPKYPSPLLSKNLPTIVENLANKNLI